MIRRVMKIKAWLLFIMLSIVMLFLFSSFPNLTDSLYGNNIYPFFRALLNFLLGPIPISLALPFIGFMLFVIVRSMLNKGFGQLFKIALLLVAAFYWLWGFNYYRSPISNSFKLNFKEVNDSTRFALTNTVMDSCIILSKQIGKDPEVNYDRELAKSCNAIFDSYPFLKARPKDAVPFKPDAFLLRIGIMGMYFPFTGQGQYDNALTLIDRPFTMAHEWSHAAGIAPEYEADFLAYLICINADDPQVRYSAYMHLLTELMLYYKFNATEIHDSLKLRVSDNMKKHIEDKKELYSKYGSLMYQVSDEMIDHYLIIHGQEGLSDYHRLSEYVFAYQTRLNK